VFGAAVAAVQAVACVPVERLPDALRGHKHANGPWCLVLERVVRFDKPVPCTGAQGLWTPRQHEFGRVISAVRDQIGQLA
jgi:hypothetical protein